ncbi:glycoside hydrolase family 47 protein [Suhomyces tanzawaensis NRRL Y-17324]|uniref:alpha-1,2-Mannosidase n=1 Tax=Suhomyces tanzawaensis NRRL Y-17324 TaxID=984487 RepID=A0A1E4SJW1_9ASCO|nr:glycoside hydrolase family 47 protein [Suhomyces tanzawaensis NRRL Y-17324]ODV79789.1 glycoside hydrolase family 47 protein [Suhomyces tanzawaensis NRRL Y-17324]
MLHRLYWLALTWLILPSVTCHQFNSSFTPDHIHYLQNETKELFKFGWNAYIQHGFPADEVRPLTCESYGPDYNDVDNTIRNDAMGNVSLTVLDNLDSLIILEQWDELEDMLTYLKSNMDLFEQDTVVQVFELSIRSLGGLLSAHLLLSDTPHASHHNGRFHQLSKDYDGFLLDLAHDLGKRLIPTYKTSTHVPVPRVNLARGIKGVPSKLQKDACTAGATTPVLEFTLLSKLTGDPQFEYYSQLTFWKLWSSKLALNLLPMTIDPLSNLWKDALTGIGASIDSFYEYSAKAAIIFDDDYMWSVFKTSYKALLIHLAQGGGYRDGSMIFSNVGINDGIVFSDWIDSLGAFWAGLQVLTGQVTDAIKTHIVYLKIWNYFELIPERWVYTHGDNINVTSNDSIRLEWYPLRPEFIESTYYLYRATRDPMYLQVGERILNLYKTKFKAKCGFSGIQDIRTGARQNRMETFVLGETLKYLYLLFDTKDENFLHSKSMNGKNWIFSTEAHPLWYHKGLKSKSQKELVKEDIIKVKKRPFRSMLSKVQRHNLNLLDSDDKSFYRNISLPLVADFALPQSQNYIKKIDPFQQKFDTCEINPFQKLIDSKNSFMISGYYAWDYLFESDYSYEKSLKKPHYLSNSSLDGSYVELTKSFYDKYTMFSNKDEREHFLQCPRPKTSEEFTVMIGDISGITQVEVSKLVYNESVSRNDSDLLLLEKDLWVPELQSLKVTFERLNVGKVDSDNELLQQDYIESLYLEKYGTTGECAVTERYNNQQEESALRINKLNGVSVYPGSIVWTLPFEVQGKNPVASISSNGRVILQGEVIENLMVWYGD